MKKTVSFILAVLLIITILPSAAAANVYLDIYSGETQIDSSTIYMSKIGEIKNAWCSHYVMDGNERHRLNGSKYIWSTSNANVVSVSSDGSEVQIIAMGYGTAQITVTAYAGDFTTSATFTVIVGEEETNKISIPSDVYYNLPSISIKDSDGANISKESKMIKAGDSFTAAIDLASSQTWRTMTLQYENGMRSVYAIMDRYGNYYYFEPNSINWSILIGKEIISLTKKIPTAVITGLTEGTADIRVQVPCGYLIRSESNYVQDAGYISTLSATAKIEVGSKKLYRNPFQDLDISKIENPYADLSKEHWAYKDIISLYAVGILDGIDTSTYALLFQPQNMFFVPQAISDVSFSNGGLKRNSYIHPADYEKRDNTVVMLYNSHEAIGGTVGSYSFNPFRDVFLGKAHYHPVLWASYNAIVNGYGNGLFGSRDPITREQFCAIVMRYADYAGVPLKSAVTITYRDSNQISGYAREAVARCVATGLLQGYPNGTFRPKNNITRAEVSRVVYNLIEYISK